MASNVFQKATPVCRAAVRCASIMARTALMVMGLPSRMVLRSPTLITSIELCGKWSFT